MPRYWKRSDGKYMVTTSVPWFIFWEKVVEERAFDTWEEAKKYPGAPGTNTMPIHVYPVSPFS